MLRPCLSRIFSYCHLLNATLCATGRVICCLLEVCGRASLSLVRSTRRGVSIGFAPPGWAMARLQTYQTEDGVRVPEVLQQYMPGKIDFFPFVRESRGLSKGEKGQAAA